MAATAWALYNKAKENLLKCNIDLIANDIKLALFQSTSNCETLTHDEFADLTNEVAAGNGYTAGGQSLDNISVADNGAGVTKVDADDEVFTAAGGDINGIRFAVIYDDTSATNLLLCYSRLDTSDINITDGNTLTIQFHSDGIFTLS